MEIETTAGLNAEAFAEACQWIVANHEGHEAHRMLDQLVTSVLTNLGFGDGMAIFLAHALPYHTGEKA